MIPTVKILRPDHPDGVVTINASDYDPKVHKLADDAPAAEPAPPAEKKVRKK